MYNRLGFNNSNPWHVPIEINTLLYLLKLKLFSSDVFSVEKNATLFIPKSTPKFTEYDLSEMGKILLTPALNPLLLKYISLSVLLKTKDDEQYI